MAVTSLDPNLPGFVPRACRVAFTACNGMVASAHPLASLTGLAGAGGWRQCDRRGRGHRGDAECR